MRIHQPSRWLSVLALTCASLLALGATWAAPPLPGAIFTTNADGTRVNQNHFAAKCDVYLDGGPGQNAPQTAAGLPDGDYYFQVTDPPGKVLLSTDAVKYRQFRVAGGIITALSGAGNHGTGYDTDHGATTIQLCAYTDTPNNGGVYKVWVTRIADFVGNVDLVDNGYSPGYYHGFIPAASKTDVFKVNSKITLPCLIVGKFIDLDANGRWHCCDEPLVPWPIHVYDPDGTEINGTLFSGPTGKECVAVNLLPGMYKVVEETTDGSGAYRVTANIIDGKVQVHADVEVLVRIKTSNREVWFGNAPKP